MPGSAKCVLRRTRSCLLDFVPALSGLIGKVALVSSFALVWAQELGITSPSFVLENVRLELIIGSAVTLITAIALPGVAPPGTLAPLIVMIPAMAKFGVHPLMLNLMVGIIGIVSVKTKLFEKLVAVSGNIGKASLALVFGVSGAIMCINKLNGFFSGNLTHLLLLTIILGVAYTVLLLIKKGWFIIPAAAVFSVLLPYLFGMKINFAAAAAPLNFSTFYWWNDMWQTGFGLNGAVMLRTLPFAVFVILLWAVDTVSILALKDTSPGGEEEKAKIDINKSFVIVALRNMAGGLCGGAQTASLWRSFLIPAFMMKRPLRRAAALLGMLGITAGLVPAAIKVLSFPPLVWTVLLFGIFIPFVIAGVKTMGSVEKPACKIAVLIFAASGILLSPIVAWSVSILFEKLLGSSNTKPGRASRRGHIG
jgi:hypothetical protein